MVEHSKQHLYKIHIRNATWKFCCLGGISSWDTVVNHALKDAQIRKAVGAARWLVEHFKKSKLALPSALHDQLPAGTEVGHDSNPHIAGEALSRSEKWPVEPTLNTGTRPKNSSSVASPFLQYLCWWRASKRACHFRPCLSRLPMLLQHRRWLQDGSWQPYSEMMYVNAVCIIAAALEPGIFQLKFMPAEERLKVYIQVQAFFALQAKRRERGETLCVAQIQMCIGTLRKTMDMFKMMILTVKCIQTTLD